MDAPARLRDGDALHAVCAALVFQTAVRSYAIDEKRDFLKSADLRRIAGENLRPPALPLGIARIHTEKTRREECRFLSSDTAANLDNDVLVIVRIARPKENRQLLGESVTFRFCLGNLLCEHLLHLGIGFGEHLPVLFDGRERRPIGVIRLHNRRECRVLARIALPFCHVRHHGGVAQERLEFMIFIRNGVQFA